MAKSQAKRDARKHSPHKKRIGAHKRVARDHFDPNTPLPDVEIPKAIIKDILEKKDLLVSHELTEHIVLRYLRKQPKLLPELHHHQFMRSAAYEKLKKWVRQELRVLVGMFVVEHDFTKFSEVPTTAVLASHRSTKERLDHYPDLYSALFMGKNPEVILDLACGLNPCSYEYLGCKPVYYAFDVSPQLIEFVNEFFRQKGIVGEANSADVTQLTEFPAADTVFLFKAMDVLERIRYGHGEKLLEMLGNRRVVVSFATATISGTREIGKSKRTWVERWAQANGRSIRTHEIPGELFYIIE